MAMATGLTAETALMLACCRWPRTADRDAAIGELAGRVDWPAMLRIARRHRVEGLVHRALGEAGVTPPDAAAATLRAAAVHTGVRGLQLAAESARLIRLLQGADVPTLVVKGAALAMLAYDMLGVKMAWDIDLLVPPEMVGRAATTLEAAGYRCALPEDRALLERWHAYSKESVWAHEGTGVHVELHSALVDNPLVLPGVDAFSPAQEVAIAPGLTLPTLQREPLFAYLCVHGAASGWRRAKWLADVAALLSRGTPVETRALYQASQRLGAGRAAGQGLLLAHRYLAADVPAELLAELRRDVWTQGLAAMAGRLMTAPNGYDDPAETRFGTVPIHLNRMLILPGLRFALDDLARQIAPDPRRAQSFWTPLAQMGRRIRRAKRAPASAP